MFEEVSETIITNCRVMISLKMFGMCVFNMGRKFQKIPRVKIGSMFCFFFFLFS